MQSSNLQIAGRLVILLAAIVALGCGSATTEVSGRVTYKGKALPSGSVTFFFQNKQIAATLIKPDGTYRISDVPLGPAQVAIRSHAKVPEGYAVRHTLPPSKDAPRPPILKLRAADFQHTAIPERFNHPEESGLAFVVSTTQTVFNIDLTP